MSAPFSCCDTLNAMGAEPRIAGHHALCPRFGLAAIEAEHAVYEDEGGAEVRATRWTEGGRIAHRHRAVLLTALREERAEVQRLRWTRGAPSEEQLATHSAESREDEYRTFLRHNDLRPGAWLGASDGGAVHRGRFRRADGAFVYQSYHADFTAVPREHLRGWCFLPLRGALDPYQEPAGALASIPPDECDGGDR